MMTSENQSQTSSKKSVDVCICGCAPCDTTCCKLDCLEQPRFYCGQLLTDQDLSKLLNWNQDKFRLNRFRDGWGVVCGLEVRCDPQNTGHVLVNPGYAVDCCGDDIIVCEPTSFDLSDQCPEPIGSCENPGQGGDSNTDDKINVVDLYIRYAEEGTAPRAAFRRSDCRDVNECEYSRTKESFALYPLPRELGTDPVAREAEEWQKRYQDSLERIVTTLEDLVNYEDGETVREHLIEWLEQNPLHSFCFLRDWICGLTKEQLESDSELLNILMLLIQDARMAFLQCSCHECIDGSGVPLARIILKASTGYGIRECRVVAIDAYSPYRRPISQSCWPTPLGGINLGQVVWHRYEDACSILRGLGLTRINQKPMVLPTNLDDFKKAIVSDSDSLIADCNEPVTLLTLDPGKLTQCPTAVYPPGERVVGFSISELSPVQSESTPKKAIDKKTRTTTKIKITSNPKKQHSVSK